jgi:hypothetical protein
VHWKGLGVRGSSSCEHENCAEGIVAERTGRKIEPVNNGTQSRSKSHRCRSPCHISAPAPPLVKKETLQTKPATNNAIATISLEK